MPSRRRSRQTALQVLFQWDARHLPPESAISADAALDGFYSTLYSEESEARPERDQFTEALVRAAVANVAAIDERITRHAEHWRLERMPAVDRNILRLAVCEMSLFNTPGAVVIDEAIELARRYSDEKSVHFINGVLDAIHKELERAAGPEVQ
jgi:N utilization substance protein B